ncbi:hypothetical protein [Streptomyces sp. NPDC001205]
MNSQDSTALLRSSSPSSAGPDTHPTAAPDSQDLDMAQVQEDLAAAIRHIEDLPHRYPYETPAGDALPPAGRAAELTERKRRK